MSGWLQALVAVATVLLGGGALASIVKAVSERREKKASVTEAVKAAAREGALSASDGIVAAVLAGLPEGERITTTDVEQAIRSVLGGLDGATPA